MEERKYKEFFQKIKILKKEQDEQKKRGLNDYNMVNVVRSEFSEVGMHSNVIYSLINPDGDHYQEDLFLNLFIQDVLTDIKDDFGEILSVNVEESTFANRRIDFTIKSSKYYIGIEMKINANDLENQLSHYEEDLIKKAEQNGIDKENVFIYYLTKNGREASPKSSNGTTYKQVSFEEHILQWINNCQKEVRNITNLNEAFENYKDIVRKITKQYKGKVMELKNFILKDQEKYKIAELMYQEFKTIQNELLNCLGKWLEKKLKIDDAKYDKCIVENKHDSKPIIYFKIYGKYEIRVHCNEYFNMKTIRLMKNGFTDQSQKYITEELKNEIKNYKNLNWNLLEYKIEGQEQKKYNSFYDMYDMYKAEKLSIETNELKSIIEKIKKVIKKTNDHI